MLKLDSSSYPSVGHARALSHHLPSSGSSNDARSFFVGADPFLIILSQDRFILPLGYDVTLVDMFGLSSKSKVSFTPFRSKPHSLTYRQYPVGYDESHYSSFLTNVGDFVNVFSGDGVPGTLVPNSLHSTRHCSFRGTATRNTRSVFTSSINLYGVDMASSEGYSFWGGNVSSLDPFVVALTPEYEPTNLYWSVDFTNLLRSIEESGELIVYAGGPYHQYNVATNFKTARTSSLIVFSYFVDSYDDYNSFSANVSVEFPLNHDYRVLTLGSQETLQYPASIYSWDTALSSWTSFYNGSGSNSYSDTGRDMVFLDIPDNPSFSFDESQDTVIDSAFSRLIDYNETKCFHVSSYDYDFISAAYLSSERAIEDLRSSLVSSVVPKLTKLATGLSGLDDFVTNVYEIAKIVGVDLSKASLPKLLHVLGISSISTGEFNLLKRLILTYVEELYALNLDDSNVILEGRGSFSYNIPHGVFGDGDYNLNVRTKVVYDGGFKRLLISLIGSDSTQLIAEFLSTQSLIPMSSLIIGFLGIRNEWMAAFDAFTFASLPCYYVHTYTISHTLTHSELAQCGISSSKTDVVEWRRFIRDISRFGAVPRQSRFDFASNIASNSSITNLLSRIVLNSVRSLL